VIEGAIRRQAAYILADPWANSFREAFAEAEQLSKFERHIDEAAGVAKPNDAVAVAALLGLAALLGCAAVVEARAVAILLLLLHKTTQPIRLPARESFKNATSKLQNIVYVILLVNHIHQAAQVRIR
jgi:hypothetical protein